LPTDTTGTSNADERSTPNRYAALRNDTTKPYNNENGSNNNCINGFDTPKFF
jgi:hypothetical protein